MENRNSLPEIQNLENGEALEIALKACPAGAFERGAVPLLVFAVVGAVKSRHDECIVEVRRIRRGYHPKSCMRMLATRAFIALKRKKVEAEAELARKQAEEEQLTKSLGRLEEAVAASERYDRRIAAIAQDGMDQFVVPFFED